MSITKRKSQKSKQIKKETGNELRARKSFLSEGTKRKEDEGKTSSSSVVGRRCCGKAEVSRKEKFECESLILWSPKLLLT